MKKGRRNSGTQMSVSTGPPKSTSRIRWDSPITMCRYTVPKFDSKFYAATQVFDEARHVEVYSRYLREKLELTYPINPHLRTLLNQAISDTRWDLTYLAMQV